MILLILYILMIFTLRYIVQYKFSGLLRHVVMMLTSLLMIPLFINRGFSHSDLFLKMSASQLLLYGTLLIAGVTFIALLSGKKSIRRATLLRVPIITALCEEILFRSILLALSMSVMPTSLSILLNGLIFGLWHIYEPVNKKLPLVKRAFYSGGSVVVTFIAGVAFSGLTIFTGSIFLAWYLHWLINSFGLIVNNYSKLK